MFLPAATKLGQGNIFTSVCQEFCPQGGEGVCLSACWDTPPRTSPPPEQTPPPGPGTPRSRHPPGPGTPPWKQTAAYGLRAAGTHPTGMHSCIGVFLIFPCLQKRRMQTKTRRLLRITSISFTSSDDQIRVLCPFSLNFKGVADLCRYPRHPPPPSANVLNFFGFWGKIQVCRLCVRMYT